MSFNMESPLPPQIKKTKASEKIVQNVSDQNPQTEQQKKIIAIAIISTVVGLGVVAGGFYGYKYYQKTRPLEVQLQKSSAPVTATQYQKKMQLDQLGALSVPTKEYQKRQLDVVTKEFTPEKTPAKKTVNKKK